ncbi:O-antigen ligase [Bradyrhizobium sp. LB7.2]
MTKLLLLPLLFIHFQESPRASWVFAAFAMSNLVLLTFSFLVFVSPELFHATGSRGVGIVVKNYIDESQAFAFLAITLAGLSAEKLRRAQFGIALGFGAAAAAFFVNLIFVNIARTAFAYLPLMTLLLIIRYVRGWVFVVTVGSVVMLLLALWAISPNLQSKIERIPGDISAYQTNSRTVENDITASGAERLEFWRKAIRFIGSAPLFGHGTGSTKGLFEAEAVGKIGLGSIVVANPHNQTLAAAIQWGAVGCLVLYAMWAAHLLIFRAGINVRTGEFVAWLGLVAVSQNVASSIFNSHLFDFYQGWLYVLTVGIASGQPSPFKPR